jgi:serine/threonine-protein kinase
MPDPHEILHAELGDRYELDTLIGEGGMGTVYRARDRKHGRPVAIKTIHPDLTSHLAPARFRREIHVTANLQHPHILPLLDSGVAGDLVYFIMPFVEGENLRNKLDRVGKLPAAHVVRIGRDVARALEYAHRRGVVHRDIKPANILCGEDAAVVADFGIAKAITDFGGDTLTRSGVVVGTPAYMAPEQYLGGATARADIYSLGAVLYEALTGYPWRGDARPQSRWAGVPDELRAVLERALKTEPEDRWPSAAAFSEALKSASEGRRATPAASRAAGAGRSWLSRLQARFTRATPGAPHSKSVAVLPLQNLNRDEHTEYFSEGITEDIIAHLSKIHDLKVISRTSVMGYKDTDLTLKEIGEQLNVATVLEGSVRRSGDRVRIVSQLIDAATDDHLWAETYDRQVTDIFAIQSEVAQRIAEALHATISTSELSMIQRLPTQDVEAHELYIKGRYSWNRRTRVGLEDAEEKFRSAIGRDPMYAPAYAGLADTYLLLGSYGYMPEVEALTKARVAVDRALELDERLASAHASRGQILRTERDWKAEEEEYLRAIELDPNYATAHQWYATLLAALGRHEEAREQVLRAGELDPLSHAIRVTTGIVRFMARDYAGALADFRHTVDLEPRFFSAYAWLILLLPLLGRDQEALDAFEKVVELRPDVPYWGFAKAEIHAVAGKRAEALAALSELKEEWYDPTVHGIIYALLGDADRAFEHLEESLADRSWRLFVLQKNLLFYMKVGPWFDAIRDDPRFEGLLRRMSFTA